MPLITGSKISQVPEVGVVASTRKILLADLNINETITYDNLVTQLSGTFGDVYLSGTPAVNQLSYFTSSNEITGSPSLTWDGTSLSSPQFNGVALTVGGLNTNFLSEDGNYLPIILLTQDEKDAIQGTDGAPSDSNRFVTNSDSRMSDSRTPTGSAGGDLSGTYPNPTVDNDAITYSKIQNVVNNNRILGNNSGSNSIVQELTAANVRSIINVEDGATADQTNAEIESAYNSQVSIVSQLEAETGTSTTVRRWTAQRVNQAASAAIPTATTSVEGIVELASTIESNDKDDNSKVITPSALHRTLSMPAVVHSGEFTIGNIASDVTQSITFAGAAPTYEANLVFNSDYYIIGNFTTVSGASIEDNNISWNIADKSSTSCTINIGENVGASQTANLKFEWMVIARGENVDWN